MADNLTLSILDVEFPYTAPYVAGQSINEAEARVLNQTRRENLSNNFRAKVKSFNEGAETKATIGGTEVTITSADQLQQAFAELDSSYAFTIANVAAAVKYTPEEKEARAIARDYLKQNGYAATKVPEGETEESWSEKFEGELARLAGEPEIVKMAKDIVKAKSKTAGLQLGALGLGGGEQAAA